jgi:hypothetical protein
MFSAAGPTGGSVPQATAQAEDGQEGIAAGAEGQPEKVTSSLFAGGAGGGEAVDEDELLYGEADASLLSAFSERGAEPVRYLPSSSSYSFFFSKVYL